MRRSADVQWVVESYALLLAALLLVGGSLGDMYGRRKIYLAGVVLFGAGSAWCGFSPTIRNADRGARRAGRWSGVAGAGEFVADHQLVSRGGAGAGDWDVVWSDRGYGSDWAGDWRVAGAACVVAVGVFFESAAGGGGDCDLLVAGAGESQ